MPLNRGRVDGVIELTVNVEAEVFNQRSSRHDGLLMLGKEASDRQAMCSWKYAATLLHCFIAYRYLVDVRPFESVQVYAEVAELSG